MAGELVPPPINTGSPAGAHSEGHRADRSRFADIFQNGFHWQKKRLPSPGTGNYAFETLALFETTPIGPAVAQRQMFKVVQPPQLYIRAQAIPVSGIGGINAGQVVLQPLIDPYSGTYGGIPFGGQ